MLIQADLDKVSPSIGLWYVKHDGQKLLEVVLTGLGWIVGGKLYGHP